METNDMINAGIENSGTENADVKITRCPWCLRDPIYMVYHDEEWGNPEKDSQKLFEGLVLDSMQAGLSWITILKRRDNYRAAFDGFNAQRIARYRDADLSRLMADDSIIRNRRKLDSVIANAQAYLAMMEDGPVNFSDFLWAFVNNKPIINHYKTLGEIPASTELSEKITKALKKKGFTFIGPTIIYAFMQAKGLVNDHLVDCYRHPEAGDRE